VWLVLGSLAAIVSGEASRDKVEYLQGVLHATDPMEQILQVMELENDRNANSWVGKYQRSALRLLGLACCRGGVLLGEQTEDIFSSLSKHIVTNKAFPDMDSLADALIVFHSCGAQSFRRKQCPAAETNGGAAPDHRAAESVLVNAILDLGDILDVFAALQPEASIWLLGRVAESRPEECSLLVSVVLQREMESAAREGQGGPLARWLLSPEGSDLLRSFVEQQMSLLSSASDLAVDGFCNSWTMAATLIETGAVDTQVSIRRRTSGCSASFKCLQYLQTICPHRLSHVPLQGDAALFRRAVLRVSSSGQEQQALVRTMLEFLHSRISAGVRVPEDCSHLLAPVEGIISACMENDAVDDGVRALAVDSLTISQVKAAGACESEARGGVLCSDKMWWVFLQQDFMGTIAKNALLKHSGQNSLRYLTSSVQYLAVSVSVHHYRAVYAGAWERVATRSLRNRGFGIELAHLPLDIALNRLPALCANRDAGLSAACLDLLAVVCVTDPKRYLVRRDTRPWGLGLEGSPASACRVAAAVANSIHADDEAVTLAATCAAAAVLQKPHEGLLEEVAHSLMANWFTALVVGTASFLKRLAVEQLPSLDEAAAASALLLAGVLVQSCPPQLINGPDIRSLTEVLHKALPKWAWKHGLRGAVVTCLETFHSKGLQEADNLARRLGECLNEQTPTGACHQQMSALRERLASPRLILTASREVSDPGVRLQAIYDEGLRTRTPAAAGEARRDVGPAPGLTAAREIAIAQRDAPKTGFDELWRRFGPAVSPKEMQVAEKKAAAARAAAAAAAAELAVVGVVGAAADALHGPPPGPHCIGWRVAVPSLNEECYYRAVVTDYAPARFSVRYDNGQLGGWSPIAASSEIQWLAPPGTFRLPGEVPVVCSGLKGTFLLESFRVRLGDRSTMPPKEFIERAGTCMKKFKKGWKVLIKVQQRDGTPGRALREWLAEFLPGKSGPSPAGQEEEREIQVVVHGLRAVFLLPSRMLRLDDSSTVTPRTLMKLLGERLEGATSWKTKIQIWNADGALGSTLGDWLVKQGLEPPELPRPDDTGGGLTAPPAPPKKRKAQAAGGARKRKR
jgi:hypothetical protein